ncbi:hypothetical protein [Enterococcus faecalis]|uniref:hypothetical protein n=1 Tax=Enterococcus faecalis TaxID=1351 RepID=UPI0040435EDA
MKYKEKEDALRQELLDLTGKKEGKQSVIVNNCNISKQHIKNYLKKGYNISDSKQKELKKFLKNYYI